MMRSLFFKFGFLLVVSILAVVSYFYWMEFKKRFPVPSHEHYVGTLKGLDGTEELIPISLHFDREHQKIFLNFISDRWEGGVIEPVTLDEGQWFAPLQLQNGKKTLRLTGSSRNGEYLTGQATEYEKHKESTLKLTGQWRLTPVAIGERLYSPEEEERLKAWNSAYSEYAELEKKEKRAKEISPRLTEEIERLTAFLNDRSRLQEEGTKKIAEVKEQYEEKLRQRNEVVEKLQGAERTYELALKVSPGGTLVNLERGIQELESLWLESQLELVRNGAGSDFQKQVERAREVVKLKEQIALEQQRMAPPVVQEEVVE